MNFTHIVDFMIMMPLGDYLMRLFEITPQQFTAIVSAYAISAGISGFVSAFVIDRFDRRTVILIAYSGFTLGTLSVSFANTYEQLIAARILTGLFGGVIGALVLSVVSDLFAYKERGKAMGIITAAFAVASVVGVPLGLFLASKFLWHAPFIMLGSLGVILTLLALWKFPAMTAHINKCDERPTHVQMIGVITTVMKDRNQLFALAMGLVIILGQFMVIPFIAPYMQRNVGFTDDTIALLYMCGGGAVVFSGPMIGKLTDRIGPLKVYTVFLILSAIPILIFTNLGETPMVIALTITTLLFIFVNGRMIPMQTMTTAVVSPKTRASFMSIKSSVQQLAAAIAALISGSIVMIGEEGLYENYEYVGVISVLITFTSLFIAPKLKVASGN